MSSNSELELLKSTYAKWAESKGADAAAWLGLMDENIELKSMGDDAQGLGFARDGSSRQRLTWIFFWEGLSLAGASWPRERRSPQELQRDFGPAGPTRHCGVSVAPQSVHARTTSSALVRAALPSAGAPAWKRMFPRLSSQSQ